MASMDPFVVEQQKKKQKSIADEILELLFEMKAGEEFTRYDLLGLVPEDDFIDKDEVHNKVMQKVSYLNRDEGPFEKIGFTKRIKVSSVAIYRRTAFDPPKRQSKSIKLAIINLVPTIKIYFFMFFLNIRVIINFFVFLTFPVLIVLTI